MTTVTTGTSNLHFRDSICGGPSFRHHQQQSSRLNFPIQKQLSCWSSKILRFQRFHGPKSSISENLKPFRTISRASLEEGSTKYYDFAIIGSGVAGLCYALEVAKHGSVAVITKAEPHESNTNYAQGGVSAVLCPLDSVESHMHDTIIAGAYLCDEETVRVVCTEGPECVRELNAMGASFDHGEDGNLHLAREGGHSHHRIVHAADMTGREIERALLNAVINDPNIFVFEHHFAIDLLTSQVYLYPLRVAYIAAETRLVKSDIARETLIVIDCLV